MESPSLPEDPLQFIVYSSVNPRKERQTKSLPLTKETVEQIGSIVFEKSDLTKDEEAFIVEATKKCDIDKLFDYIHSYFINRYPEKHLSVKFCCGYWGTFNLYCENEKNPVVYMDVLVTKALIQSLSAIFIWDEYSNDPNCVEEVYKSLFSSLKEQAINKRLPTSDTVSKWFKFAQKDRHILELTIDAYYLIITFALAHELAHIYLGHLSSIGSGKKNVFDRELEADLVAYDYILYLIDEQTSGTGSKIWDRYYEHAYLAPLMFFDYYDLIVYTAEKLGIEGYGVSGGYPSTQVRREKLLETVNLPKYVLNTEEGNIMYNCFLDGCDMYKDALSSVNCADKEFRRLLISKLQENNLPEEYVDTVVTDFIETAYSPSTNQNDVLADSDKRLGFIVIEQPKNDKVQHSGISVKFKNVSLTLDLKKLLNRVYSATSMSVGLGAEVNLINTALISLSIVLSHTVIKLTEEKIAILLIFHKENIYKPYFSEVELPSFIELGIEKYHLSKMSVETIMKECQELKALGCLSVMDGKWYLKEKVVIL